MRSVNLCLKEAGNPCYFGFCFHDGAFWNDFISLWVLELDFLNFDFFKSIFIIRFLNVFWVHVCGPTWRSEDSLQELVFSFTQSPGPQLSCLGLVACTLPPEPLLWPPVNLENTLFKSGDYLLIIFCVLKHRVKYVGDSDAHAGPRRARSSPDIAIYGGCQVWKHNASSVDFDIRKYHFIFLHFFDGCSVYE